MLAAGFEVAYLAEHRKKSKKFIPNGLMNPTGKIDFENAWLTIKQAAKRLGVPTDLVQQWVRSAKVRVHPNHPNLVNVGDLEDAIEQDELLNLTMRGVEREENE